MTKRRPTRGTSVRRQTPSKQIAQMPVQTPYELRPGVGPVYEVVDLDHLAATGEVIRIEETHTREHVEEDHVAKTTTTDREVKERVVDLGYGPPPPGAYWVGPSVKERVVDLGVPVYVNGQVGYPEGPKSELTARQSGGQQTPEQAFEEKLKSQPPKMVLSTKWILGCLGCAVLALVILALGVGLFRSGSDWAVAMVVLGGIGAIFFLTRIPHGPLVEAANPSREWLIEQGPRYYRHG